MHWMVFDLFFCCVTVKTIYWGKKSPVLKIGERFQRKLENLQNYYAFKNFRLSIMFPNHAQLNKPSKQFGNL